MNLELKNQAIVDNTSDDKSEHLLHTRKNKRHVEINIA